MGKKNKKAQKKKQQQEVEEDFEFPRFDDAVEETSAVDDKMILDNIDQEIDDEIIEEETTEIEGNVNKSKKRKMNEKEVQNKKQKSQRENYHFNLSFKDLEIGMRFLGAIKEVSELELLISLPNNLTGSVSILDISPEITATLEREAQEDIEESNVPSLTELYKVGQLVSCIITNITNDEKKKIELSLYPEKLNPSKWTEGMMIQASVKSQEDHGYVLNLGSADFIGFLPKENHQLLIGQTISCFVGKVKGRSVHVCLKHDDQQLKSRENLKKEMILPGTLVQGKITKILAKGLICRFLDSFEGLINVFHSMSEMADDSLDLESNFTLGQTIKARVLYTPSIASSQTDSYFGLTVKQNIIDLLPFSFPNDITIGSFIDRCQIKQSDAAVGSILALKKENNLHLGFIHCSRLDDSRNEEWKSDPKFKLESHHKGRVIGFDYLDGVINLTFRSSDLSASFFSYADVKVGQVVKDATILKLDAQGQYMVVSLSQNIRAICHGTHFADLPRITQPEKRFKVGSKIKVRVWSVEGSKIKVTCKKTLIQSKLPIFNDLNEMKNVLQTGELWVHGVVTQVKPFGCFVSLFGQLSGLLHQSKSNERTFQPGQLVHCRVEKIEKEKVYLTLLSESEQKELENKKKIKDDIKEVKGKKNDYQDPISAKFPVGSSVIGTVQSIKSFQANVLIQSDLPKAIMARLDVSECLDSVQPDLKNGLSVFQAAGVEVGKQLTFTVIHHRPILTGKQLSITHQEKRKLTLELSLRKQVEKQIDDYQPGERVTAFITKVETSLRRPYYLWLHLNYHVHARVTSLAAIKGFYQVGMPIECQVIGKQDSHLLCSMLKDGKAIYKEKVNDYQPGDRVQVRVTSFDPHQGLNVVLSEQPQVIRGRVSLCGLSDNYDHIGTYEKGQILEAVVISIQQQQYIDLSIRKSQLENSSDIKDPEIKSILDLQSGQLVRGFIKRVSNGLFVQIGYNIVGRVKISELSDEYIKDWEQKYQPGQLIQTRILSIDSEKIELTCKLSQLDPEQYKITQPQYKTIQTLQEGEIVNGTITKVMDFGVFIDLDQTRYKQNALRGLCHKSECSDQQITSCDALYSVGDRVRVKILKIDLENNRVNLGLKSSYFYSDSDSESDGDEFMEDDVEDVEDVEEEFLNDSDVEEEINSEVEEAVQDVEDSEEENNDLKEQSEEEKEYSDFEEEEEEDDDEEEEVKEERKFSWKNEWNENKDESEIEEETSDQESGDEEAEKLTKRQKRKKKATEEEAIRLKEEQLANGELEFNSASDFERLLLKSPNSSYLWIQYMAFYLKTFELEKAREVAEKALKSIHFREEVEKKNVWFAYLNMENQMGTEESLRSVFDRAIQYNEAQEVYLHLAKLFEKTEKFEKAEKLYEEMIKKFKHSLQVWVQFGYFYYAIQKQIEKGRSILERALQLLPKQDYLQTILKFALFEYAYGSKERARTIFEGIVSNYPKRTDLWSVYIDQEIKFEDFDYARRLFERCLKLKLSSKKMKFFFKKYLEFEKSHGTESSVEHVMQLARSFIENMEE